MGCCFGNNRDAVAEAPGNKRFSGKLDSPLISISSPIRSPQGDIDIRNVLSKLSEFKSENDACGINECLAYITDLSKKGHGEKVLEGMQYIGFEKESNNISKMIGLKYNLQREKNTQDPSDNISSSDEEMEKKRFVIRDEKNVQLEDSAYVWKAPPKYLIDKDSPERLVTKKKSQFFLPHELLGHPYNMEEPESDSDSNFSETEININQIK